ncbi:hypothetical protein ACA910_001681 [Epithemia clementina (nom. ined.)]
MQGLPCWYQSVFEGTGHAMSRWSCFAPHWRGINVKVSHAGRLHGRWQDCCCRRSQGARSVLLHRRTDIGQIVVHRKLRIGVLGSTRGTALVPVMDACASGMIHVEIVAVVSNKASAPILDLERLLGKSDTVKAISA